MSVSLRPRLHDQEGFTLSEATHRTSDAPDRLPSDWVGYESPPGIVAGRRSEQNAERAELNGDVRFKYVSARGPCEPPTHWQSR